MLKARAIAAPSRPSITPCSDHIPDASADLRHSRGRARRGASDHLEVSRHFEVWDEPYFIELQDAAATHILLTADYGSSGEWPVTKRLYGTDTSLQADGRTRVLGYTKSVGKGGVTYFALGHCHSPAVRADRSTDPTDTTPATFHGAWDSDDFVRLVRNAVVWGSGG